MEEMTAEERNSTLNEVKILKVLHHPNIIQYSENFIENNALMIAMEYAQGMHIKLTAKSAVISLN